jgi:glycosyltransferase involved in cell wall biosynthesis
VLAIGTIEPRKDYPTLVAAFDHVAADHPDIRLVIAGSEGGATRALDAAVTAARCRERIMRLGYVDETTRTAMLAGASALAYPSIYEEFGLPPLEAMAAGVPVVATDGGAIPEVVGDGAVVVPVGDEVALATALNRILDDDGFRHALVTRGLARASSYSWQATGGAMAALYDDAAADRRSRTSWRS